MPTDSAKRDDLIRTAHDLFQRHGFGAVGIDRVIAEAGVAKATLYRHFPSKDDLVLAVLRRVDEESRGALVHSLRAAADDPRGQLLAVFDVLPDLIASGYDRGCLFHCAASEFPGGDHPVHAFAREHKRLVRRYFVELATAAKVGDPDRTGGWIFTLFEGVFARSGVEGNASSAEEAKRAAELILSAA